MRSLDLTYQPPLNDPAEDGVKHWDNLRQQLMLTRDALSLAEGDLNAARRRIAELEQDKEKLSADREADRNECVTLRTQLQQGARLFLDILRSGQDSRGPKAYAPKAHRDVISGQVAEIEEILKGDPPKFLTDDSNTDQQSSMQ